MNQLVHIDYTFFKSIPNLLGLTLFGFFVYYLAGYGFNPEAFSTDTLSTPELISYLLIDQYLIECISTGILFGTVIIYARLFNLNQVKLTAKSIGSYFAKFLPLALVIFFVVNPITQTIRFLWRFSGDYDWAFYADYYLFHPQLYFTYTAILSPLIFLGLGINMILQLRKHSERLTEQIPEPENWTKIKALTDGQETVVLSKDALWFEVENRNYFLITEDEKYRISHTIAELEEILDDRYFFRVNRSTIVNLLKVKSYSHWDNGRYILRMADKHTSEHTIPRNRVSDFKEKIRAVAS